MKKYLMIMVVTLFFASCATQTPVQIEGVSSYNHELKLKIINSTSYPIFLELLDQSFAPGKQICISFQKLYRARDMVIIAVAKNDMYGLIGTAVKELNIPRIGSEKEEEVWQITNSDLEK
ncbi:hypothetical protein KKH35_02580 [Patescibacteria group bacterium]|nr:hypothetical protein [Patescibacteria group bacterium]